MFLGREKTIKQHAHCQVFVKTKKMTFLAFPYFTFSNFKN